MDLCIANDIAISQVLIVDDVLQVPTSAKEDITIQTYFRTKSLFSGTGFTAYFGAVLFESNLFEEGLFE